MGTVESVYTILTTLAALAAVLLLAYLILKWMGQKMPMQTGSRHIQILDRVSVSQDKCLILVRVAEKTILVGMSSHSIEKVCDIEDPEETLRSTDVNQNVGFAEFLKESIKRSGFHGGKGGTDK